MRRSEVISADVEYVALLDMHAAEDIIEVNADQRYWEAEAAHDVDPERTGVWSYAFETDDESRLEMEADDIRCGGTFSELLHGEV